MNLALGKPAWQSSDYQATGNPGLVQAGLAVDGDRSSTWYSNWSCSFVNHHKSTIQWWMVDLQDYYQIDNVVMVPRNHSGAYLGKYC